MKIAADVNPRAEHDALGERIVGVKQQPSGVHRITFRGERLLVDRAEIAGNRLAAGLVVERAEHRAHGEGVGPCRRPLSRHRGNREHCFVRWRLVIERRRRRHAIIVTRRADHTDASEIVG